MIKSAGKVINIMLEMCREYEIIYFFFIYSKCLFVDTVPMTKILFAGTILIFAITSNW